MLRDEARSSDGEGTWAGWGTGALAGGELDWMRVDRELRGIAKRRAALDAGEARWLREAERLEIWRPLGMVSLVDYMERVLGYAPRTAQQRLQVARALETLPALTEALESGELSFSAVRELARVATPSTEHAWCAHVGGFNLRQIEEAVAGHRPGDLPTDAPDDAAREHVVTLRLDAAAYATWRQGRTQLDEEHDHRLDDSEVVSALFAGARIDGSGEIGGRAKFQIALSVCPRCERGVQEGGGVGVHVDAATVERARCDALHVGSVDGDAPERARQDIPPSVVRFVFRRDRGRCQTPGCRSARGIEIHHIEHREHGGSHEPKNLTLRCSACHVAHHRGLLDITGEAPERIVTTRRASVGASSFAVSASAGSPASAPVRARPTAPQTAAAAAAAAPSASVSARGRDRFAEAAIVVQARQAMKTLGWSPTIARDAIEQARAHVGANASLETLLREALRRCPVPRMS